MLPITHISTILLGILRPINYLMKSLNLKKLKDENNNQIFIDDFKIIFIDDSIDLSNLF
jgi:hypothetical protein